MRSRLLMTLVVAAFAAAPAKAQEAGLYAGLNLGFSVMESGWATETAFDPVLPLTPIPFTSDPTADLLGFGVYGGAFAGYGWDVGSGWQVGVEGDIGWNAVSDSVDYVPGLGVEGGGVDFRASTTEVKGGLGGSIRARAGYMIDENVQLFATAGLALQDVEVNVLCPLDTEVCNPSEGVKSKTTDLLMLGYTLGAGVQFKVTDTIFARAEYRFSDYGTEDFRAIGPVDGELFGADASLDVINHQVLLGVGMYF